MNRPVLVVGGGPAGFRRRTRWPRPGSASCWWIRPTDSAARRSCRATPSWCRRGEWAKDAIGGMVRRVESNKLIDVTAACDGQEPLSAAPGDFHATLSDGRRLEAGAAVLCTGFTHFDSVNKPEWGFGTYPDVVTTTQVEQMFSSGKGVRCPSDGREPERVAILLCVGSRDRQIGREWCSKICCTVSSNLAMEIREAAAEVQRLHLLHGYPHLRSVRGPLLLGEPGEA